MIGVMLGSNIPKSMILSKRSNKLSSTTKGIYECFCQKDKK